MKKLLAILLSALLLLCTPVYSFASNCKIEFDNIDAKPGEFVDVPVRIMGNPGIMGFGFNFSYNSECLEVVSVSRGANLVGGMLEDSVGSGRKDNVKIIWTGTSNFKGNGELFVIRLHVKEDTDISYTECSIDYIEEDTFNENWRSVSIDTTDLLCIGLFETDEPSEPVEPEAPSNPYEVWSARANESSKFVRFLIKVFVLPILYLIYEI